MTGGMGHARLSDNVICGRNIESHGISLISKVGGNWCQPCEKSTIELDKYSRCQSLDELP